MYLLSQISMWPSAQDGSRRSNFQVLVNFSFGIDTQQSAAAKEQFSLSPGRPFGIPRSFGKLREFHPGQFLRERLRLVALRRGHLPPSLAR